MDMIFQQKDEVMAQTEAQIRYGLKRTLAARLQREGYTGAAAAIMEGTVKVPYPTRKGK